MEWTERYRHWEEYPAMEPALKQELLGYGDKQAQECFYKELSFGTGGLRGILGAGTNRMNIYTVAKATRGLAKYLLKAHPSGASCAIAYDSRNGSEAFAQVAAVAFASAGIQVYLYEKITPTPMLSFAVRHLQCSGGVVITASHNPAEYNGYKVYDEHGCQITLEAAEEIQAYIQKEPDFWDEALSYGQLHEAGRIAHVPAEVEEAYYRSVLACSIAPLQAPLKVVYSPLHGAGNIPVRTVLGRLGKVELHIVPEQEKPDGNFPTCPYPNPEEQSAMVLSAKLAKELGADFFFATDPDCDRVGAGVPTRKGMQLISGNEMGVLLLDFICSRLAEEGRMPQQPLVVKTIVTTEMAAAVANRYGVEVKNVLTGFKFIGEEIGKLEALGQESRFLFGFEESFGYLSNTQVRDKDAVNAALLICEMASFHKARGKNLLEAREEMFATYGYYQDRLLSFAFSGMDGMQKMAGLMAELRKAGKAWLGKEIVEAVDYWQMDTGLPKSDVLAFSFEDRSHVVVRPSGTEPKLKMYVSVVEDDMEKSAGLMQDVCGRLERWIAER